VRTPEIQHIGHAGFVLENGAVRLAIDPWFYPAILESWFPYPGNRHFMGDADGANWIYVSHHHQDHFDKKYLSRLNKEINIIVPRFRSRRMERLWKGLGFHNLYVLDHGEGMDIGSGVAVTMFLDRGYREDSALLIEHNGYRFLDMNDCDMAESDIPHADILAAQHSGASWYPHCYEYDYETFQHKAMGVRENVLTRLMRKLELSHATSYIPSAGPPAFCDPALVQYNSDQPYGTIYARWDAERTKLLNSSGIGVARYHDDCLTDPVKFRTSKLNEPLWKAFYERDNTPVTTGEIDEHFRKLIQSNSRLLKDYRRSIIVGKDENTFQVSLSLVAPELEEAPDPHYWIGVPNRVLRAVINGDATWEEAVTSNRCYLNRKPDSYDSTLMTLLICGDQPAVTRTFAEQRDRVSETIVRKGHEIPRWCPHAGEDLREAEISCDNVLTCPRHHWQWDVVTGECLTGGDIPLRPKGA
jgi:UDP-MurNAc hydroxylase